MNARSIGFWIGLCAFLLTLLVPPPGSMPAQAWPVAGMVVLMAAWWMSEAIPLTATALVPFLVLPLTGTMTAADTASAYYSPVLFLILGGAFIALAVERTGLHCRLALAILRHVGEGGGSGRLLLAFMISAAILSMIISNTSTTLIMMPMALAVMAGGGIRPDETRGLAGALPIGIAFGATIGGLGTIVGSPTNAISVALLRQTLDFNVSFAMWTAFGLPVVIVGIPLAAFIIARTQKLADDRFDLHAARDAIAQSHHWTVPERRLVPLVVLIVVAWVCRPLFDPLFPPGALTDGTIAIIGSLLLFILPDGTGRPLLTWEEADRAPWGVIMMFGGGLALAAGMGASGLAGWIGDMLLPLEAVPLPVMAVAVVALVIVVTEFASNVATASGIMPVVASMIAALHLDPVLLALPVALASSWGFMLPAGTGPNAIAWATGHIALPKMLRAGFMLDVVGAFMIVALVWAMAALF
ncbi:DASS family sodium-coupled anion symporter [Novosphingobium sp. ZN18A2]|uniref:SLC13 family permease n=1 Tax=Novosphingobium sp. ZN18A2 TaxID=3079861 RepID=UPI0030CD1EC5